MLAKVSPARRGFLLGALDYQTLIAFSNDIISGMTASKESQTHRMLEDAIERNTELLKENNKLLKRLQRNARWGLIIRLVWFAVLIGLPFALYFYVLEPYFTALGSSYDTFEAGVQEIPGYKQFHELLDKYQSSGQPSEQN